MAHTTGIIPCQEIHELIKAQRILATDTIIPDQIQPASIDLRLGHYAYPVITSFLPGRNIKVLEKMQQIDEQFDKFKIDLRTGAVLEKDQVYVIPLLESLALPDDIAGFANPKSSTGRLDILTRLIADGSTTFDQLGKGYTGQLYVEVAPRSFSVVARTGIRLNQLRFYRGYKENKNIEHEEWKQLIDTHQIVANTADLHIIDESGMLRFTVDLKRQGNKEPIGYRAKKYSGRIDLEERNYDAMDFWEPIYSGKNNSLVLDPHQFYILMTKEAISIPPDYAAEMVAYDTRAGEFRVHYAGFFDPGFGWDIKTGKAGSSRGVLEVRSHEVPFLLEHGQTVGWLRYERMAKRPDMLYGQEIQSNYQGQRLKLAKQFR